MDIRALRYFVELVREQSFTRASEKLFVTQPTISKMIRNMEEELGQPLLSRVGRRFTLTDSGQVLFNRAQTILAEMQQLEAELADLQSLQSGRLALGIPPMVGHVYADLIRTYRSRYPGVELSIVEYGGRRIEQAVLAGELDLAITMLPTREGAPSVPWIWTATPSGWCCRTCPAGARGARSGWRLCETNPSCSIPRPSP